MVKDHIKRNRTVYICVASNVAVAGITALIMRGNLSQPISVTVGDAASRTVGVAGKKVLMGKDSERISRAIGVTAGRDIVVTKKSVLNNVSYIYSNRKGAPSWVVRCLETGNIFTSQREAALAMNLTESHLSQHLNGVREHVNSFHFERICMAA